MTNGNQPEGPVAEPSGIRCDFCGKTAASVRRVALDHDYERLQTPHKERYACPDCSQAKEEARRGLRR